MRRFKDMGEIAKILIGIGTFFIFLGGLLLLFGKIPGIGKLPGDILIKKDNFTFYFPLATSILLSIVLSLILAFLNRNKY